jgi:phosphatidylglycerophosphate synthase
MSGANRRPLASRQRAWAARLARRLTAAGVAPNAISIASTGFAAAGAAGLATAHPAGLVLAAAMVQGRLLCNLMDGMVAIEGGRRSRDGAFWNEAPDRLSDVLLLAGAGVGAGSPVLGLAAGALAVATAYLRELGRAEGFAPDFSGPMAKPQRMAALTAGALVAALPPWPAPAVLAATLWIVALGTGLTVLRRSARLIARLKAR